jgi:hypothetical protein
VNGAWLANPDLEGFEGRDEGCNGDSPERNNRNRGRLQATAKQVGIYIQVITKSCQAEGFSVITFDDYSRPFQQGKTVVDVGERNPAFEFLVDILKGVISVYERSQQSGRTALERNTITLAEEENQVWLDDSHLEVALELRPADHGGPDSSTLNWG